MIKRMVKTTRKTSHWSRNQVKNLGLIPQKILINRLKVTWKKTTSQLYRKLQWHHHLIFTSQFLWCWFTWYVNFKISKSRMINFIYHVSFRLVESAPRITVHTLDTVDSCTHEVAVPPNQEYTPLNKPPGEPAKTYPFTLDPFQEQVFNKWYTIKNYSY